MLKQILRKIVSETISLSQKGVNKHNRRKSVLMISEILAKYYKLGSINKTIKEIDLFYLMALEWVLVIVRPRMQLTKIHDWWIQYFSNLAFLFITSAIFA